MRIKIMSFCIFLTKQVKCEVWNWPRSLCIRIAVWLYRIAILT